MVGLPSAVTASISSTCCGGRSLFAVSEPSPSVRSLDQADRPPTASITTSAFRAAATAAGMSVGSDGTTPVPDERKLGLRQGRSSQAKHLRIYWWMFNSPAYRSLDCTCRCGLHELMFNHNGRNNGDIIGSIRWLRDRLGVGINTAIRVYATLQQRGFIKVSVKGGFDWKAGARKGEATRWHLTMIEGPNGEKPTKDFMTWVPEKQTTDSPWIHAVSTRDSVRTADRHQKCIRHGYRQRPFCPAPGHQSPLGPLISLTFCP